MEFGGKWRGRVDRWLVAIEKAPAALHLLIMAVPFLVVWVAMRGLTDQFLSTSVADEDYYHWPSILQFAQEWPSPDLVNYRSATGPLFHLIFAWFYRCGMDMWMLRSINMVVSYLGILVLYRIMVQIGTSRTYALILSTLFAISPYFFGSSFVLMTDNLAVALALGSLYGIYLLKSNPKTTTLVWTCLLIAAALMTRQFYAWLLPPLLWVIYKAPATKIWKVVAALLAVATTIPIGMLMLQWRGPVPPEFQEAHAATGLGDMTGTMLLLSLIGAYSLLIAPSEVFNRRNVSNRRLWAFIVTVLSTWIALFIKPVPPGNVRRDGWLVKLSTLVKVKVGASSILLYLLGAIGLGYLWRRWPDRRDHAIPFLCIVGCSLVSLRTTGYFQKYYDPLALIFLFLTLPNFSRRLWIDRVGVAFLFAAFTLFHIVRYV
ncbi:MAG: hypothetical protein HONBIEJF_02792 [Fimbriimonadaceae bacterium]|nr:hypothetical protein [Fimbriimonadaceae bacterium]